MPDFEVLVLELVAINALSTIPITLSDIAALNLAWYIIIHSRDLLDV